MDKDKEKISLLKKTSRYFLLINAFLMLLGTVVLYFYTRSIMQNEVEEELYSRSFRLEHYVSSNSQVIELPPVFEVKEVEHLRPEVIKDTLIYDPSQDEMEKFRELTTYRNLNGNNYQIIVRSMMVETEEIILIIFFLFCIILLIIF
ncbi:MAG: sensor histidine kinase, partial [Salegentibacter sp.]